MRLAQQFGTAAVAAEARKLGITTPISTYPAMALGTSPTTLLQMTAAYAGVAAGRRPIVPTGLVVEKESGVLGVVKSAATAMAPWPARDPMLQLLQSVGAQRDRHGQRC